VLSAPTTVPLPAPTTVPLPARTTVPLPVPTTVPLLAPTTVPLFCSDDCVQVLERVGITLITNTPEDPLHKNVSLYEHANFPPVTHGVPFGIAAQVRVAAADGEARFNGTGENNVKALWKDPVRGYGDRAFEMVCASH